MRKAASSDVFKVWLYAAASVLLGAWISPLLYNAGKALAEVSSSKQTNGPLEWLAGLCRTTDFPGFFKFSLLFAAGLLGWPVIEWLRGGRVGGQPLCKNPRGWRQAVTGFLLVTLLFLLIGGVLILTGILAWKSPGENGAKLVLYGFAMALGRAVLQEILFRGIVLGVFLRALRPASALGLSALLFALVHFLNPPPGLNVADPDAAGVGFELLRKIVAQFADLRVVVGTFTPLLALGGLLAHARWRTASLCLPVGLHSGWIFVNSLIGSVTVAASPPGSSMSLLSAAALSQGLVPLVGILLAGALTHYITPPADATAPPA